MKPSGVGSIQGNEDVVPEGKTLIFIAIEYTDKTLGVFF